MSTKEQQPLLLEDCDDYIVPSKWDHFQRISFTMAKNINWFITISSFIITIAFSILTSGFINDYMHQSLQLPPNLQFDSRIRRDLLMDPANNKLNIDSIEAIDAMEHHKPQNKKERNRAELQMLLKEEDQIIDALKEDVKGQKGIEEQLMEKIKGLEREHLKVLHEQKHHESNMIWIGIAMSSIMCVAAAFLFYAVTVMKRDVAVQNKDNTAAN